MTRNVRQISRRLALLGMVVLVATGLYAAVGADAAGTYVAHAAPPTYDTSALELLGDGAYTSLRGDTELPVTACLQKALGARVFSIRGQTGTATGRRVTAQVAVPGCVKGSWRTTSSGEALSPKGEWVHRASATSAPYRC